MSPNERRWLTISEISELISVNPKTASAWALCGRLPAARIGGRGPWRIDRLKLEESLESQIKDIRSAGCLGAGTPRRRGACQASKTRGQRGNSAGK